MNCCGEETKKEEKQAEEHATHATQGHSYGGCCGMGSGWMQWMLIAVLLVAIASYFLR